MKTLSTRVEDWIAEEVEKLGKTSDVLREAILLYLSNKVGICDEMRYKVVFLRGYDELVNEIVRILKDLKQKKETLQWYTSLSLSKILDAREVIAEAEDIARKNEELTILLEFLDKVLSSVKIDNELYNSFNEVVEKYRKYLNNMINTARVTSSVEIRYEEEIDKVESLFYDICKGNEECIKYSLNLSIKLAITFRKDVFASVDLETLSKLLKNVDKESITSIKMLEQGCGNNTNIALDQRLCEKYRRLVSVRINDYVGFSGDIAFKFKLSDEEEHLIKDALIKVIFTTSFYLDWLLSSVATAILSVINLVSEAESLFNLQLTPNAATEIFRGKLELELENMIKQYCVRSGKGLNMK